jgi:hypothetical protein
MIFPLAYGHGDVGKLLMEIIALPSVNPAFVPEGTPGTGEKDQVGSEGSSGVKE